jgi:hypothetical protein
MGLNGYNFEKKFNSFRLDPLSPPAQAGRINRKLMLEMSEATKGLPVRILEPSFQELLIAEIVGCFEVK